MSGVVSVSLSQGPANVWGAGEGALAWPAVDRLEEGAPAQKHGVRLP